MKKLFVVDTNVVLFDHTCIYNFQEHDVALSIVVLEELDRFKRGNDLINLEARQFIRELDELAGDGPLTEGLPLGRRSAAASSWRSARPTSGRVSQAFALEQARPPHPGPRRGAAREAEGPRRSSWSARTSTCA